MTFHPFLIFLISCKFLFFCKCATFENVKIQLIDTRLKPEEIRKLKSTRNAQKLITIASGNNLADHIQEFTSFETVKIQDQIIQELTPFSIAFLAQTTDISIRNCGVKTIHPKAFWKLPALKNLDLSRNLLKHLGKQSFSSLVFRSLRLSFNEISTIEAEAFSSASISIVRLDHNNITNWDYKWFENATIQGFSISHNHLKEIPENALLFWANNLPSRFRKTHSQLVDFSFNKIQEIHPTAFYGVCMVNEINLRGNLIKKLVPGVFDLTCKIGQLNLEENLLKEIDAEMFMNTYIKSMKFRKNWLKCVPPIIQYVTEVYSIDFRANPVTCECLESWKKWRAGTVLSFPVVGLRELERNCSAF